MNDASRILAVSIATVILESLLYGIFLVCFFVNLYIRVSKYANSKQFRTRAWSNPVVVSTMAIFLTYSGHWILTVVRFSQAVLSGSLDTEAALLYYGPDSSQRTQVVRSALAEMTVLIGDAVIIHRLWLIWNRNFSVVVLPIISWVGVLVCGVAIAYLFSQSHAGHNGFSTRAGGWVTANWALPMTISVYCTALITWQIWSTSRVVKDLGDGVLMPVLAILVESAAIWTAWAVFFAIAYQRDSLSEFIAKDLTPSMVALTNMFIHLRVGFGWSCTSTPGTSCSGGMTSDADMGMFRGTMEMTDSHILGSVSTSTSPPNSSN
ncbi:hypothetical protein B0H17DRAFT_1026905 [Mycena rosella]|uniref:Uncharacterized protein n=1 Tax=Mycena rosella TaxID=1033263 RepID=A0AAD7H1U7_MYCRO|nr:hypothetical protein B0H17DRAFT_1026905 [Mycena rosella]